MKILLDQDTAGVLESAARAAEYFTHPVIQYSDTVMVPVWYPWRFPGTPTMILGHW